MSEQTSAPDPLAYATQLVQHLAPGIQPEPDLYGLLTQLDNFIAGQKLAQGELDVVLESVGVPTEHEGRELPADERVLLLIKHFHTQYARLDRGIASLWHAIDAARQLLSGPVVTYKKIQKACVILSAAADAVKVRQASAADESASSSSEVRS